MNIVAVATRDVEGCVNPDADVVATGDIVSKRIVAADGVVVPGGVVGQRDNPAGRVVVPGGVEGKRVEAASRVVEPGGVARKRSGPDSGTAALVRRRGVVAVDVDDNIRSAVGVQVNRVECSAGLWSARTTPL